MRVTLKRRHIALRLDNIRMSSRSTNLIAQLKHSTGLPTETLARFALCMSLKQQGIPNPDEYNRAGSELTLEALFGENRPIYTALVLSRLRQDGLDPKHYLNEMIRAHLNRGAISLKQRVSGIADFYRLVG